MGKETFHPGTGEEKNFHRKDFRELTIWQEITWNTFSEKNGRNELKLKGAESPKQNLLRCETFCTAKSWEQPGKLQVCWKNDTLNLNITTW